MQELGMIEPTRTTADVLVAQFDADSLSAYLKIAAALRGQGIATEVFPDAKKLKAQFKYADRRGFRAVVLAGKDELTSGRLNVKWLEDGSQCEFPLSGDLEDLGQWLRQRLG